jgi:hypothetical protein
MNADSSESMDCLMTLIFRKAWRVWKSYDGKVPEEACRELDRDGDWPRGLAHIVMGRIRRDAKLREQLETFG